MEMMNKMSKPCLSCGDQTWGFFCSDYCEQKYFMKNEVGIYIYSKDGLCLARFVKDENGKYPIFPYEKTDKIVSFVIIDGVEVTLE